MGALLDEPLDLLLGLDNDLVVTTDLALSRGLDGVAQACRVALQLFFEEWFLNLDVGLPYLQSILGQRADAASRLAKAAARRELLLVIGVQAVTKLDASFDSATRTLTFTWQARTSLGITPSDTIAMSLSGGIS